MTMAEEVRRAIDALVRGKDRYRLRRVIEETPELLQAGDSYGITLLHAAAQHGISDCVELLIQIGANVDAKNNFGQTPLAVAWASYPRHGEDTARLQTFKLLLEAGASPNIACNNGTALYEAVLRHQREPALLFLKHGADVDLNSALVVHTVEKIRERLLANPQAMTEEALVPNTLLATAVSLLFRNAEKSKQLVALLLEHGANPNQDAAPFCHPLISAVNKGGEAGLEVARLLLEHGADPNATDEYGLVALRLVENDLRWKKKHGFSDMKCPELFKELLEQFGATRQPKRIPAKKDAGTQRSTEKKSKQKKSKQWPSWQEVLDQMVVRGNVMPVSEEELVEFETTHNVKLPASYRDYCKVFGPGSLSGCVSIKIAVPGNPDWEWTDDLNQLGRYYLGNNDDWYEDYCPDVELWKNGLFFASTGDETYWWDTRERTDPARNEMPVYLATREMKFYRIAETFESLIFDRILGEGIPGRVASHDDPFEFFAGVGIA